MYMVMLVAVAMSLGPLDSLSLILAPTKPTIMVGEPAKLTVTWSVISPLIVSTRHLQILVGDGPSLTRWHETAIGVAVEMDAPTRLEPDRPYQTSHVVSVSGRLRGNGVPDFAVAFAQPGIHKVRVRYGTGDDIVTSNVVGLNVVAPTGTDATLFEALIRRNPQFMTVWVTSFNPSFVNATFAQHPTSAYLRWSRLHWLAMRIAQAIAAAPDPTHPAGPVEGDVPGLLEELASLDLENTPLEEDRLFLLASMYERSGRRLAALSRWQQIVETYPLGEAAAEARRRLP